MKERYTKVLRILSVILIVGIAVSVLTLAFGLFGRRPLPPLQPSTRVAPNLSHLPPIQVCWAETGHAFGAGRFSMTASALLIRHPNGDVLIDAGNSTHFDEEASHFPFLQRLLMTTIPGRLKPKVALPDALHAIGEEPGQLKLLIPSHIHLDHIGGYEDLPRIPILLDADEMSFSYDSAVQKTGAVIHQQATLLQDGRVRNLQFLDGPYEIFTQSYDLYRDGSIVVVSLPGHTPGSIGVFVNLDPDHRFLYIGDAALQAAEIANRIRKPFFIRDLDSDQAAYQVRKLNQLHDMDTHLEMIAAHGRTDFFKAFPKGPGSCIQSAQESK